MGFLDKLRGARPKPDKCDHCGIEADLPFDKKFPEGKKYFCSKKCSGEYRKERKKRAKKTPQMGGGLPF